MGLVTVLYAFWFYFCQRGKNEEKMRRWGPRRGFSQPFMGCWVWHLVNCVALEWLPRIGKAKRSSFGFAVAFWFPCRECHICCFCIYCFDFSLLSSFWLFLLLSFYAELKSQQCYGRDP